MANKTLQKAKAAKQDEFYTQLADIQNEMNAYLDFNPDVFRDKTLLLPCDDPEWSNFTLFFAQNFERFGLKKLISTSYAIDSKHNMYGSQLSLFETNYEKTSKQYDANITRSRGKIFILDRDCNADGCINYHDLKWEYLKGDGDFRSDEVKALRDEADIIITNPPFSLFREFMAWLLIAKKQFVIIGSMMSISYKEVFPHIKNNKIWLGRSTGGKEYKKPDGSFQKMGNTCWFTNIDHGRRHQPLTLMSTADVFKYSKHKDIREMKHFYHYENYDAIDIPRVDAIPCDYNGIMGVPTSFLYQYCPDQFEIIGIAEGDSGKELGLQPYDRNLKKLNKSLRDGQLFYLLENGIPKKPFARILIRKK